jgi:hypothetical protein
MLWLPGSPIENGGWRKVLGMSVKTTESGGTPRCSFCHRSQDDVAYLIASPTDYPRAYICDECVEFCHSALSEGLNKHQTEPK